jgi:hypothetical protein
MKKESRHERNLSSPRLRGEVGSYANGSARMRRPMINFAKIRVRGTLRELYSRQQPLTPTLSPQARGEGAH